MGNMHTDVRNRSNELREAEERNKPQRLLSNEQHRKRAEWEENKKCCQGSD